MRENDLDLNVLTIVILIFISIFMYCKHKKSELNYILETKSLHKSINDKDKEIFELKTEQMNLKNEYLETLKMITK